MPIVIQFDTETHEYTASATPPESREEWRTESPLTLPELINKLEKLGCHTKDISEELHRVDPGWLARL